MQLKIFVKGPKTVLEFVATLHKAGSVDNLFLDPQTFYIEYGKCIPDFPHYEIEITSPSKTDEFWTRTKLHVHTSSKNDAYFVCYPRRMESVEQATIFWCAWCIGAVLTADYGKDLNEVFTGECKENMDHFFKVTEEKYGIKITIDRQIIELSEK